MRLENNVFFVTGGAFKAPEGREYSVYITHHGNVDCRTLPRFPGAELTQPVFHATIYRTDAKPDEVVYEVERLGRIANCIVPGPPLIPLRA